MGYKGNLCQGCDVVDGNTYERVGDHECAKCINSTANALKILFIGLFLLFLVILVIMINLRSSKESNMSVLFRIVTNYFHIVTSAASFNLSYPNSLASFFQGVKTVGEAPEMVLSTDCFIKDRKRAPLTR